MPWWKNIKLGDKSSNSENLSSNNEFFPKNLKIELEEFSPKNYDEVQKIANTLKSRKSVKLNLQNTIVNDRRRVIDFVCGVAYALNYDINQKSSDIYEFRNNNN